jgi:RNA polymerase sigma-70 factor (ECF subfamily)
VITPALPASHDESTTAWTLAARGGDPRAVEHFVRALQRDVSRYVTYLGADPQAAEDLTQDTFLRALSSLHRFEGRSSARSWLLFIARRVVADSLRRHASRPRLSDTGDWQRAVERAQPRGLPGFDDGVALTDLLVGLPDERREAFVLAPLVHYLGAGPSQPGHRGRPRRGRIHRPGRRNVQAGAPDPAHRPFVAGTALPTAS